MHLYVFGSLCRGEIDPASDVDILAITDGFDGRFDPEVYSLYSYERIRSLWSQGNAFAWHLALEAKQIFSSDQRNFLADLGQPAPYKSCVKDCDKFLQVYQQALGALSGGSASHVFELSTIFLAVRNFATCFSLGNLDKPIFSRNSAKSLGRKSLRLSARAYSLLERSRILATRGSGSIVGLQEMEACLKEFSTIGSWMNELLNEISRNGRVH